MLRPDPRMGDVSGRFGKVLRDEVESAGVYLSPQRCREREVFEVLVGGFWDSGAALTGLACVDPYGAFGAGLLGDWSALRWVVFAGWFARGEILRVAQNDKGDRGGFPASFLLAKYSE